MRLLRYLLVLAAVLMVAAVPLMSSSADADSDTLIISEDLVLTEDTAISEHTVIINNNITVNVGEYTLTLSENTQVFIPGSAYIVCGEGGSIVAGAGSSLVILGTALKSFTSDVTFTFDGALVFSLDGLTEVDVEFLEDSTALTAAWGDSAVSLTGFKMHQELVSGKEVTRTIGFSALEYTGEAYDGETLVSTKHVTVQSSDANSTVVTAIHFADTILDLTGSSSDITIADLTSVTSVTSYTSSDVVNTTEFTGLGPTSISVGADRMANITTAADTMTVEKAEGTETKFSTDLTDVGFTADVNIDKLLELVSQGITGDTPDWLQYLNIVAATAEIDDAEYGTSRTLTDLSLLINPNDPDQRYLLVEATDGSDEYTLAANKVVIESYALSKDLELDLKTSSTSEMTVTFQKTTDSVAVLEAELTNVVLEIEGLEIESLVMLYSRTGTMSLQHLMDHSDKIAVTAATFTLDSDADGEDDTVAAELKAVLQKNTLGIYTLTANFDTLSAKPVLNGTECTLDVDTTTLYMEVSGPVAECLDFLVSGSHFTADAHAEVQLTNAGFSLTYPLENGQVTVEGAVVSTATSPPDATVQLSIDHSVYKGTTTLSGALSYLGHALEVEIQAAYTDPDGTLDAVFGTQDGSGSFEFVFGSTTEFSVSLNMPWDFGLEYYGIDVDVRSGTSGLSLSHGSLDVDGFDITQSGALDLPFRLLSDDCVMGFRISAEVSSLDVYRNDSTVPDISCSDIELTVRNVSLDLKHGDRMALSLNKIVLAYVNSQGVQVEDSLERLNIDKDLSGAAAEKGLLDTAMQLLLPVFAALIVIVLVLLFRIRIREPELLKMNENTDEEHYGIVLEDDDEPADWGDPVEPENGTEGEQSAESLEDVVTGSPTESEDASEDPGSEKPEE